MDPTALEPAIDSTLETSAKPPIKDIIALEKQPPDVLLIVTRDTGEVLFVMSERSRNLAELVEVGCARFPELVKKTTEDLLCPLGQDAYDIRKSYFEGIRWAFFSMKKAEMDQLLSTLPEDAVLTLIVSY